MPYLRLSDAMTVFYDEFGSGPRPVVLIHGAAQDSVSWRFVGPELARHGYRALAIDLPGHGKSSLPAEGPIGDLGLYSDHLAEIVPHLADGPVALVGHSMAGGILLQLALRHPRLVSGLVILDGTGFAHGTYNDAYLSVINHNPSAWFEVNFRAICSLATPSERVEEIAFDVQRCPSAVAWHDIAAYARLDLRGSLDAVRCPVVFLHGADDWSITPQMARETAAECRNAATRVEVLEGTGHFPHVEAPDLLLPKLLPALDDMAQAGPPEG